MLGEYRFECCEHIREFELVDVSGVTTSSSIGAGSASSTEAFGITVFFEGGRVRHIRLQYLVTWGREIGKLLT